jgi:hypothetical protein
MSDEYSLDLTSLRGKCWANPVFDFAAIAPLK